MVSRGMLGERNLTLIGMPGAGKTSIGEGLAAALAAPFLDTDWLMEERWGCSLQEFIDREGLAALIGEQKDMEIVGQAGDGSEAVERARELQPDVIIMDVAMPVMPGDEATRRIKAEMPQMRVVALSMFAEPGVREKMLDAGAEIYLPKTGPSEELLAAIRGREQ